MPTDVDELEKKKIDYPWLVFKLEEEYYTINSKAVLSIMTLPSKIIPIPQSSQYVRGVFEMRGEIIPLIELRSVFGMKSLLDEYAEFSDMLEQRKQDHINWVSELERCIEQNEPFKLATDPHKCAFGKWYDQFESELHSVNHHMGKIDDPHRKLHQAALHVEQCQKNCDTCEREVCLKEIMHSLEKEYVPKIISLLDEAKDVFRVSFREMVIILEKDDHRVGIITDEIIAVEELTDICHSDNIDNEFVASVRHSGSLDKNILALDDDALMRKINQAVGKRMLSTSPIVFA